MNRLKEKVKMVFITRTTPSELEVDFSTNINKKRLNIS